MTIWSNADHYYEIIKATGRHLIVFGEIGEQWTDEVLHVFNVVGVHVNFFPWERVVDLRLQLEIVCYPYTQLWHNGSLQVEIEGYHNESLQNLIV